MGESLIKRFALFSSVTATKASEAIIAIELKRISKILTRFHGKK